MSATKVLDQAEKQGLLDANVIAELRRQVAESKFVVTPEAIAKVLVDHGHLTPFQARKLVATALGQSPPAAEPSKQPAAAAPAKPVRSAPQEMGLADEMGLAEDSPPTAIPPAEEEEVVMLEAVSAPAPPKPKPQPKTAPPATKPAAGSPKPSAPAAKAEPPKPAPAKPAAKPKTSTQPAAEPVMLEALAPLPSTGETKPGPLPALTPLTDAPVDLAAMPAADPLAGSLDPFAAPLDPLANNSALLGESPQAKAKKKGPKNVWDSPLLLIGGGGLGVLVIVFALLYYALTRGSAAELFAKGNEDYQAGSYTSAIAVFDSFIKKYPDDPNASLARVRRGMAQLRQVTDDGKNPRQGLQTAKAVLPEIENETAFNEARLELCTILPDIADGFATQATDTQQTGKREELVQLAGEAFELVNNPAYLPASLRKDRENRIAGIQDKLKVAQRSIDQDQELAVALGKITDAAGKGDAPLAYQVRGQLLRTYPGLEAHPQLVAAIRAVGDKERDLVQITSDSVAAATTDSQPAANRVVLAVRTGPVPAAPTKIAYVLIEGAVYGIDVASGKVLWRRHVGYETTIHPQPVARTDGANALVVDSRRQELLCLEGATGKLVWRQAIGQPLFAPVVASGQAWVTTRQGRVLKIDLASGNVALSAQLPQGAGSAVGFDAKQSRLIQPGQHSTLFVLSSDTLVCSETFYLGHTIGSILVPPVAILDQILALESPADDHTLIHVLAPGGEGKGLTEVGQPLRLKGRVVVPPAVAGRRVAVVTDVGQVAVYEVDPAAPKQPVRSIGAMEASEKTPTLGFQTLEGNQLWLASRRLGLFEVQGAVAQLARKWTMHQDDAFLAPSQVFGETLVHVRRRPGSAAVIVEGCPAAEGKPPLWTTQLAAPVAALVSADPRRAVDAITRQGAVFTISSEQLRAGYVDTPLFSLAAGSRAAILPEVATSRDGKLASWTEPKSGGKVALYDVSTGAAPVTAPLSNAADEPSAAGVLWNGKVLVPVSSGKVELLEPPAAKSTTLPFMPTLSPDRLPAWGRPAVLSDESGFVICDGARKLYRVGLKTEPQPHLAAGLEKTIEPDLQGSLAAAGDTVYGIARGDTGDVVVAIDPQTLTIGMTWPLTGRAQLGPSEIQGLVFVASETDGLLCLEGGQKLRWQRPLARGPLAGLPVQATGGDLLLLYQSGGVARIAGDTGEEVAHVDLAEPLGRTARVFGQQVFVATSDGAVVQVPLPQRP